MTTELTVLILAALLWVIQFFVYIGASHGKMDINVAMGPRDSEVARPGISGRLHRALGNHAEGLILFTIAAMVLTVSDKSTAFTAIAAWLYLVMRILYVPAYAFGWTPWRTLIWMVGFGATIAMLIATLL